MIYYGEKDIENIHYGYRTITAVYYGYELVWEAIRSCFGSGMWINEKPWINNEGWRNNP